MKSWRLLGDLGINPVQVFSPQSPQVFLPAGFPSLSEENSKGQKQLSHVHWDFYLFYFLFFVADKLKKLCPDSLVTTNGLSLHFMSDINVITEAQAWKGQLGPEGTLPS